MNAVKNWLKYFLAFLSEKKRTYEDERFISEFVKAAERRPPEPQETSAEDQLDKPLERLSRDSLEAIAQKYFDGNQGAMECIDRAYWAYHAQPDEPGAHKFPTALPKVRTQRTEAIRMSEPYRNEVCGQCGKSRVDVRWGSEPPRCGAISPDRPTISEVILREESSYLDRLNSAETLVPKLMAGKKVSGETLAWLYQTHGFDYDCAVSALGLNELEHRQAYDAAMQAHSDKARRAGFKVAKDA